MVEVQEAKVEMRYRGGHNYECERCHCPMDAGEGRLCTECKEELKEIEAYAKRWSMTMQQAEDCMRKIGA